MTLVEFVAGVSKNCWDWDLKEFSRRTGFEGNYAKEKFLQFRDLNNALCRFDLETLRKLAHNDQVAAAQAFNAGVAGLPKQE